MRPEGESCWIVNVGITEKDVWNLGTTHMFSHCYCRTGSAKASWANLKAVRVVSSMPFRSEAGLK